MLDLGQNDEQPTKHEQQYTTGKGFGSHDAGSLQFLVGGDWNMTCIFPYIVNVIIPTDFHSYFSEGFEKPPTRFIDYP